MGSEGSSLLNRSVFVPARMALHGPLLRRSHRCHSEQSTATRRIARHTVPWARFFADRSEWQTDQTLPSEMLTFGLRPNKKRVTECHGKERGTAAGIPWVEPTANRGLPENRWREEVLTREVGRFFVMLKSFIVQVLACPS